MRFSKWWPSDCELDLIKCIVLEIMHGQHMDTRQYLDTRQYFTNQFDVRGIPLYNQAKSCAYGIITHGQSIQGTPQVLTILQ
jgi:hypothetical protein